MISDEKTDALFIISILWLEVQPLANDPIRPRDHPSRAACCLTTPQDDTESRASFYWNRATHSKTRGRQQAFISVIFRKPRVGSGFGANVVAAGNEADFAIKPIPPRHRRTAFLPLPESTLDLSRARQAARKAGNCGFHSMVIPFEVLTRSRTRLHCNRAARAFCTISRLDDAAAALKHFFSH